MKEEGRRKKDHKILSSSFLLHPSLLLAALLVGLLLIPFFLFEARFNALAMQITGSGLSRWVAAAGIFTLLALDIFLPVPSSIVATAAGVLLGLVQGAAIVWAGMMAGCLLGYIVGVRAWGAARWVVGPDSLSRAEDLMRRYGDLAIVVCRPVPVLAEASVVFAGIARAPVQRFAWLTGFSNLGIAIAYSAVGALSMRIDSFLVAFLGALLLPGVAIGVSRITFGRSTHG
jgi:uncharacterized membrane protein YdjX (TVP38/TMEM64 family)